MRPKHVIKYVKCRFLCIFNFVTHLLEFYPLFSLFDNRDWLSCRGLRQIRKEAEVLRLGLISQCQLVNKDVHGPWVLLKSLHHLGQRFHRLLHGILVAGCALGTIQLRGQFREVADSLKMSHCAAQGQ